MSENTDFCNRRNTSIPSKGKDDIVHYPSIEIDVDLVAQLSNLYLTPQEKEKMHKELERMVEFAGNLKLPPSYEEKEQELELATEPLKNVFHEDHISPSFPREKLLEAAPTTKEGYFFVPKTVE